MKNNLSNKSSCYGDCPCYGEGVTLKYRVYLRLYLIKIKSVLANFGSEKLVLLISQLVLLVSQLVLLILQLVLLVF